MPVVVLDTNQVGLEEPMGGNDQRVLIDAAHRGQLVLAIPELVVRESMNKWREAMTARLSKLEAAAKSLAGHELTIEVPSRDDLAARGDLVEQRLRETLSGDNICIPGFSETPHEAVVQRALDRRQPFDKNGRNGYRDALLWETVLELAAEQDVILVSNDLAAFANEDKSALSARLAEEAEQRLARANSIELLTDVGLAVERFAAQDAAARDRVSDLVRFDSFRAIFEEQLEDAVESYILSQSEIAGLGLGVDISHATVAALVGAGQICVERVYAVPENIGLADLTVFARVGIAFFAPMGQARLLRDRKDVWPIDGEWDELWPFAESEAHLITPRHVKLDAESAIRLVPGTAERLEIDNLQVIKSDEFLPPDEPLEEEPGEVWDAEGGEP